MQKPRQWEDRKQTVGIVLFRFGEFRLPPENYQGHKLPLENEGEIRKPVAGERLPERPQAQTYSLTYMLLLSLLTCSFLHLRLIEYILKTIVSKDWHLRRPEKKKVLVFGKKNIILLRSTKTITFLFLAPPFGGISLLFQFSQDVLLFLHQTKIAKFTQRAVSS